MTPVLTVSKQMLVTYNLWDNTIHLSGFKRVKNVLHYVGELHMGANVNFREDMDMSAVELGCLLIIFNVKDWLEGDKFPSDCYHVSLSEDHGPDEFVLLMMAGYHSMREEKGQKCWDKQFVNKIQKNMKITVKGDGIVHFKSLGKFFGFGMMAKCNKKGVCSYARVVEKKKAIPKELNMLYQCLCVELQHMAQTLNDIIPGVVKKGQCIINELVNISQNLGTEPHELISALHEGMMTGMVCYNAQTGELHFEKDSAFTFIGIPFGTDDINAMCLFVFEFGWGEGKFIRVKLIPGTVLYYTGFGIMHRQFSLVGGDESLQDQFWNLAVYANKSFYEKSMSSFERIKGKHQ